jgi:hypothetical protein
VHPPDSDLSDTILAIHPAAAAGLGRVLDRHDLPLIMAAYPADLPNPGRIRAHLPALDAAQALLCRLFIIGEPVRHRTVSDCLSADVTDELLRCRILRGDGDLVSLGRLRLVCHFGALILCEYGDPMAAAYYGSDSIALRRLCHGLVGRILDFGAGVGAQGISLAGPSSSALCIEKNADLRGFFEFNAALNEVCGRVSFMVGDTANLDTLDERFDAILCPPMMPVPAALKFPLTGNGGESGQEILLAVLARAGSLFAERGQCRFLATILGGDDGPDLAAFERLPTGSRLDISLVATCRASMASQGPMFKAMISRALDCGMTAPDALSICSAFYGREKTSHLYFCLGNARRRAGLRRSTIRLTRHYRVNAAQWNL